MKTPGKTQRSRLNAAMLAIAIASLAVGALRVCLPRKMICGSTRFGHSNYFANASTHSETCLLTLNTRTITISFRCGCGSLAKMPPH